MLLKGVAVLVFLFLSFLPFGSSALALKAELPDCDDLKKISQALEQLSKVFETSSDKITEGDELDKSLGELIDALGAIAKAERDSSLNKALITLTEAYNNMDADKFSVCLKEIITAFDRIYRRDC
ncbi:MAG: hypothetical protein LLG06_08440 [Desulfobacteraceae bacterium]|nr:hypothetical protein [Desulfobacteraceae bacterium]